MIDSKSGLEPRQRLLLLDRHALTRRYLASLLGDIGGGLMVEEAASMEQLGEVGECSLILINVVSATIQEPWVKTEIRRVKEIFQNVPVAMICNDGEPRHAITAIQSGIQGYILPNLDGAQLLAALRLIMTGGLYIGSAPAQDTTSLAERLVIEERGTPTGLDALTPRETEVLQHLRQGKPNKLIAFELKMSENTVKVHVNRIMRKMGAPNRTAVAFLGATQGQPPLPFRL